MSRTIKLTKGFDIKLEGEAIRFTENRQLAQHYAIKPVDFRGIVPKLAIEEGSEVKAGDVLFSSKSDERVKITSPVSGEIAEIKRGPKRVIEQIRIIADKKNDYKSFGTTLVSEMSVEEIKSKLLDSGVWIHIKQRPFNRIASPDAQPKNIFISGFDSSPLGVDFNYIVEGKGKLFQAGVDVLKRLTIGKVYLSLSKNGLHADEFTHCKNVELNYFDGPHPAGNVGVQIHHLAPINKGETVWTLTPQDVIIIGRLFEEGIYNPEKLIALCGSQAGKKCYYPYRTGANIAPILENNLEKGANRIISGNVLTGTKISEDDTLGFYDNQITVIPEGEDQEFLGWLIPTYERPSFSKTFLSYLMPNKKYKVNTNMHGEHRAFVVTGEYEKVLPMDILPLYLLKAILANDIENMEALGIYEVVEEDFALCEFICTSKMPLQSIIRQGLNIVESEA